MSSGKLKSLSVALSLLLVLGFLSFSGLQATEGGESSRSPLEIFPLYPGAEVASETESKSSWRIYTEADGLIQFVDGGWKSYKFGPLERGVKDIAVAAGPAGDTWVKTKAGLARFSQGQWQTYRNEDAP